jgi:haloalkane dehalogenase
MHYVDEGRGSPLVFVHGTPTWSFEWRHLIRAFRHTHRCIAADHLGFGLSDRPRDFPYTPEAHAENFARFLDGLGLDEVTLVVHDFGGPIALPSCLGARPRVRRVVLINTWMWSLAGDRDMERKARIARSRIGRFLYRRLNFSLRVLMPSAFGDRSRLGRYVHRQYLDRFLDPDSRERVLWSLARSLLDSGPWFDSLWQQRDRLAGFPTLVLWGLADPALRPHLLERWKAVLPQASVIAYPRAGHWPHEEIPTQVARDLGDWLGSSEARRLTRRGIRPAPPSVVPAGRGGGHDGPTPARPASRGEPESSRGQ